MFSNFHYTLNIIRNSLLALIFMGFMSCEKLADLSTPSSDKLAVFDEAWKILDERYALFSVKNIDWKEVYSRYHSQLNDATDDRALFRVISNMNDELHDGHVALFSPFDSSTYTGFYSGFAINFNYANIQNNYLKNDFKTRGPFVYKIDNNVGYIFYRSFEQNITGDDLDGILSEMASTKGLIIDVRSNKGGSLANADEFFQRFITEKKLVKYEMIKKGKGHDDFFSPNPYFLSPEGNYYNKPICVLTNRSCFSACNDFVMYMSALSNVTIVGDQTGGGGGIPYDYVLSNGWKLKYTATQTLSPAKLPVEPGIQPNITVGITPIEDMNGKDPILEKAFETLQ